MTHKCQPLVNIYYQASGNNDYHQLKQYIVGSGHFGFENGPSCLIQKGGSWLHQVAASLKVFFNDLKSDFGTSDWHSSRSAFVVTTGNDISGH